MSRENERVVIDKFKEVLRQNGKSDKTARSYVGALTSKGVLTKQICDAKIMPEGASSLLLIEDEAELEKIARWWWETGRFLHELQYNATARAAMPWLLKFRGISLDSDFIEANPRGDKPPSRMVEPPYGISLRSLMNCFVKVLWDGTKTMRLDTRNKVRNRLILKLMKKNDVDWADLPGKAFQEHTYEFYLMRNTLLKSLNQDLSGAVEFLETKYSKELLERACRQVVKTMLDEYGGKILADLRLRRVDYENSVLFYLNDMYQQLYIGRGKADQTDLLGSFLGLVKRVLLDCDPADRGDNPELVPGCALNHEKLLADTSLLWAWLDWGPVSSGALEQLLQVHLPREEQEIRLRQALFCNLLHTAGFHSNVKKRDAAKEAEGTERALVYLDLHWDQLKSISTQKRANWWPELPEEDLIGGKDYCLLTAHLRIHQAELLLMVEPKEPGSLDWGYRMMLVQEALRRAEKSLENRTRAKQDVLEKLSGRDIMQELWVRLYLCHAELYRQLALQENKENCLVDIVTMYIAPARKALELAQLSLEDKEEPEEHKSLENIAMEERLKSEWHKLCGLCIETFFYENTSMVVRMRLRKSSDNNSYRQEFECWKKIPGQKLESFSQDVPKIYLHLNRNDLLRADQFDTIYCGVFDSTLGKNPEHLKNIELMFFQMLSSGRVCLLQMNQIVDNRSMLQLLPTPGFRQACREGLVSLSCYGTVNDPKTYLINNLNKPGFQFSSSDLYKIPKDADTKAIEASLRGAMLHYLKCNDSSAFRLAASEVREEAEFLMDAYAILFECFQPSDLLRFHQNSGVRMPPAGDSWQPIFQPMGRVMQQRLEALTKEALAGDTTKSEDTLRALAEYGKQLGFPNERSPYVLAIQADLLREGLSDRERNLLVKFGKLVDQCYFLSNGRRSCRRVLLNDSDPDLIQKEDFTLKNEPGSDVLEYILRQKNQPASDSNLSWPDVCQLALEVRRIDEENQKLSDQERTLKMEQATGLKYSSVGNGTLVTELTPKLSTGEAINIAPDESADAQVLEFHTV